MTNSLHPSPISCDLDFARDGAQHGFLRLPWSRDDSAWGAVMIPISVIRNGAGPTALVTAGNHGDEYEGPIALHDLAAALDPAQITGRIIILPAMNAPAFRAGTRTSPIDGGNLNRLFPGRPDGTPTQKIADYVTRHLLPLADCVLDFHSGGRTLDFLPLAACHILPDKALEARCREAVAAFGAPYALQMIEMDAVGMFDTTAEAMGKTFVTTELGGAGTATPDSIAIAKRGLRGFLAHAGILAGDEGVTTQAAWPETIWLDMPDGDCFLVSEEEGLIEPLVTLGDRVACGDVVARIYPFGRSGRMPLSCHARRDGIVMARHVPGLVKPGDCIAVFAVPAS
ncbi:N(2)-acetyl-L-2,4-diaminobutanoate deacetylase DoeB [Saliniramus sp.]|uniref:N(2)-acetyl-L-2,4-diaminobutanoate deacetylase DoeB n=1 Tax=Saliniramus sp. TaxID=2986772 RepID=UPI002CB6AF4E|nr:N(2)-acetyl-L-2,4-diaminobutanoate deacetylase DoeB [Saliniramus sp.]HMB12242.1 N(2)-acetyl-L-2,4-diaminobutanoate deacetylase DoeB [Saliniramus sp.]